MITLTREQFLSDVAVYDHNYDTVHGSIKECSFSPLSLDEGIECIFQIHGPITKFIIKRDTTAFDWLLSTIGIPRGYANQLDNASLCYNLEYMKHLCTVEFKADIHSNKEAVKMYSPNVPIIRPAAVLESIEHGIGFKCHNVAAVSMDQNGYLAFAVVTDKNDQVEIGDVVYAGVHAFYNTENAEGIQIAGYLHRLVCTNGAISGEAISRYTRKNKSLPMKEWISASSHSAMNRFHDEMDIYRNLSSIVLNGNTSNYLTSIFDRHGFNASLREYILGQVVLLKPKNAYEVHNIITSIASHSEKAMKSPQWSTWLMQSAGAIARDIIQCDSCGSVVSEVHE